MPLASALRPVSVGAMQSHVLFQACRFAPGSATLWGPLIIQLLYRCSRMHGPESSHWGNQDVVIFSLVQGPYLGTTAAGDVWGDLKVGKSNEHAGWVLELARGNWRNLHRRESSCWYLNPPTRGPGGQICSKAGGT